jgi:hypothetical protein
LPDRDPTGSTLVLRRTSTLRRILAHTDLSIHDVINSPVARNRVAGYYRLSLHIDRRADTLTLERQWNPLGRLR